MITRKIGALLAAGCTCVVKPSPESVFFEGIKHWGFVSQIINSFFPFISIPAPLSALALASLSHKAGFPAGGTHIHQYFFHFSFPSPSMVTPTFLNIILSFERFAGLKGKSSCRRTRIDYKPPRAQGFFHRLNICGQIA